MSSDLSSAAPAHDRSLPALDLLRIAAALYVVLFHMDLSRQSALLGRIFSHGPSATGLFFLLSGFLLTWLHLERRLDGDAQKRFVWRRLARIWPANLLGLACIVGYQAHFGYIAPTNDLWLGALMLQTWLVGRSHILNTPAWSVSCLLFFYLLFPVLLPALRRLRTPPLWALAVLLWVLAWSAPLLLLRHPGHFDSASWQLYLHNSPLFRLPAFVLGMLGALLVRRSRPLPRWVFPATALLVVLTLLLAPGEALAVNNEVFAPLSLLLIAAATRPPAGLQRLGQAPWAGRLASATLCVYLLHSFWIRLFEHLSGGHWTPALDLLFLIVVWGSALLADTALCRPVTRWLLSPRLPQFSWRAHAPLPLASGDD